MGGYANKASANVMWCKLKKKLGIATSGNVPNPDDIGLATPPKTPAGKGRARAPKKPKAAPCKGEDEDMDAADFKLDESSTKVKTESENEVDEDTAAQVDHDQATPEPTTPTKSKKTTANKTTKANTKATVKGTAAANKTGAPAARGKKRARDDQDAADDDGDKTADDETAANEADAMIGYHVQEDDEAERAASETPSRGRKRFRAGSE